MDNLFKQTVTQDGEYRIEDVAFGFDAGQEDAQDEDSDEDFEEEYD